MSKRNVLLGQRRADIEEGVFGGTKGRDRKDMVPGHGEGGDTFSRSSERTGQ